MKHYFLTDNSGAPLKIESLSIAHEEIKHAWTYDTPEQLLKVFNEKSNALNRGQKPVNVLKIAGYIVIGAFSLVGLEDFLRLFSH